MCESSFILYFSLVGRDKHGRTVHTTLPHHQNANVACLCPSSFSSIFLICQDFGFNHSTESPATNLYTVPIVPKRDCWFYPLGCVIYFEELGFPAFDWCFQLWISSLIIFPCDYLTFTAFGSPFSSILVQGYRCHLISFKIEFCFCFLFSFLLFGDFSEKREIVHFTLHSKTRSFTQRVSFAYSIIFSFSSTSHIIFQESY